MLQSNANGNSDDLDAVTARLGLIADVLLLSDDEIPDAGDDLR